MRRVLKRFRMRMMIKRDKVEKGSFVNSNAKGFKSNAKGCKTPTESSALAKAVLINFL